MATIPDSVTRSVKRFLLAVQKDRRIDAAYVYGSQTSGTSTEWSDIDVAVISPDFSSDRFEERVVLMRLAAQIDDRIEPHPFTPWDFQSSDPLADEVRNTGIRVA